MAELELSQCLDERAAKSKSDIREKGCLSNGLIFQGFTDILCTLNANLIVVATDHSQCLELNRRKEEE